MKKILFYLFLSLSTYLPAQQGLQNIETKLDSVFGHYNIGKKPGVSIAIMEKGKPTFFKSYGHANLEYQIKNTPNTLFNATDLAKQFTVFSMLLLQEEGKLSINDDIKKYLPQLNQWPFEITLKHLMEQTSGLRDVMELKKWIGYKNGDVITKQDILDMVTKQKHLNFPAGSKFEYNRTGFVLLTEVIAKVSGIPFSEFVDQQHIFTPLEMTNSVFMNTHTELIPNRTYSYAKEEGKYIKIANNSSFVGGTNLYTSTSDFAKWLQNTSKQRIGKPAFYEYMQTHITLSDGQKSRYTPGIFKSFGDGYWKIHLEGFDHGYTAYMMYLAAYDFSMIFFSNDLEFDIDDMYDVIYDSFNTDYNIPPVQPSVTQSVKFVNKSIVELQDYTGSYLFEDNFSIRKIVLENDTLRYVRSETNRTPIVPIAGNHTFKMLFPSNDNILVNFKNKGEILEFIVSNPSEYTYDYITLGKKFKFQDKKQTAFSSEYRNDALGQTIILQNTNEKIRLTMDGISMVLNPIRDNEFLVQENPKVNYVKLQRDGQQNIIGMYLSNRQIKNLYYKMINE